MKTGYDNLEIYQLALSLCILVHKMTLNLPKYESYGEGSQIRRSAKSIAANIVEGYGRRFYIKEYLKFLTYAHASCDETKVHLKIIFMTGLLKKEEFNDLTEQYLKLGRKIYKFIEALRK